MGTKYMLLRHGYRLAAALFAAGLLVNTSAALAESEPSPARTVILRRLSFVTVNDLDFGDMISGTIPGQVRLFPDGARTATGGVTLVGNRQQPAVFSGYGTRNQQVLISMSSNSITITGPGAPMTVTMWEIGSTPTAILTTTPTRFRITSTSGLFTFPIGARLAVGANQAPGVYTGNFSITLNYL